MPHLSIAIPAYDNASNLPACLDSILSQGYEDWEAIVVVDGSPDNSAEIVRRYAEGDARVRLVNKASNEGTHRARMSGVEAARGDYLLFLDADDELAPDALGSLARLARQEPEADVIHFGMEQLDAGVSPEMLEGFLESCNRQFPTLKGSAIAESSFVFSGGPTQDWRVLQRLFKTSLVKEAFSHMTSERLGRGQDAYEWLVIASLADEEVFHNESVVYRYFFGRGITNTSEMGAGKFGKLAEAYAAIGRASGEWALSCASADVASCSEGLFNRLCELLFGDWVERVPDAEKAEALRVATEALGGSAVAAELMRLARDDAYKHWTAGDVYTEDGAYVLLFEAAEKCLGGGDATERYRIFRDAAAGHIADLRDRSASKRGSNLLSRAGAFVRRRFGKV